MEHFIDGIFFTLEPIGYIHTYMYILSISVGRTWRVELFDLFTRNVAAAVAVTVRYLGKVAET